MHLIKELLTKLLIIYTASFRVEVGEAFAPLGELLPT